ncbi:MBL fold metallo-hydrolase [Saccharopolyspora taberi]|uniref:MBL fold metallo-hydrolase n=1 Tax=Saccharopolyspora taberi TaxID=60895 RepID=A0ABN3VGE4_9PSEU
MHEIALGEVTITRVVEYFGSVDMTPAEFFPESSPDSWEEHRHWLEPDFVAGGEFVAAVQTWVLRSEGRTILIDTGVGNHRERPEAPIWDNLETDFPGNLARAGVRPEDVDVVVNTHLHVDHVGWNTHRENDSWVPTFPNATYLIPRRDFDFWNPANGRQRNRHMFEDSITPVHQEGRTLLWDDSYRIDGNLRLDLAAGHTPGSSVVTLESGSDRAVFVGDLMHSAYQFAEPDTNSCFCEDPARARATRHRVLGWAADNNALVLPAHLGGHGAAEINRDGSRFAIRRWAPFSRL